MKVYTNIGVPAIMIPSDIVKIRKVVYDNPNTVVVWDDDTVTKCKCSEYDKYDEEKGLLICILKKFCGSQEVIDVLNSWIPEPTIISEVEGRKEVTLKDVRRKVKGN